MKTYSELHTEFLGLAQKARSIKQVSPTLLRRMKAISAKLKKMDSKIAMHHSPRGNYKSDIK